MFLWLENDHHNIKIIKSAYLDIYLIYISYLGLPWNLVTAAEILVSLKKKYE